MGVVKQLQGEGYQEGVLGSFNHAVRSSPQAGAEVIEVDCPSFEYALGADHLIMPAEVSSNLAPVLMACVMAFAWRTEGPVTADRSWPPPVAPVLVMRSSAVSSSACLCSETSPVLHDAYYGSAQKVRTLVQRDFAAAFEQCDVLVSPTAPTTAFTFGDKIDDPIAMILYHVATIPANLAGVPGLSLPSGLADEDGLPVGFQILAPARGDATMYRIAGALEAGLGEPIANTCPATLPRGDVLMDELMDFDEAVKRFDPVIGLEVHVELVLDQEAIHGAPNEFGGDANTSATPVSLGLPGSLPGGQQVGCGVRHQNWLGAQLLDCRELPFCAQELLLPQI